MTWSTLNEHSLIWSRMLRSLWTHSAQLILLFLPLLHVFCACPSMYLYSRSQSRVPPSDAQTSTSCTLVRCSMITVSNHLKQPMHTSYQPALSFYPFEIFLTIFSVIVLFILLHATIEILSHTLAWLRINTRPKRPNFTMQPTALDLKHCVSFFILTIPYHWHALRGIFACLKRHVFLSTRKPVEPSYPVRYLLECSLVNYVSPAPELGPRVFRFQLHNFLSPIYVGKTDCSFVVEFDIESYAILKFEYNGLPIDECTEQLSLLVHTTATASHPAVHKHQDEHYSHRKRAGPMYDNMFLHGPLLNEYAYFYAGLLFRHGVGWFRTVLEENSVRVQPRRHSMETYRKLMPHSRYVQFAMGARPILFQLIRIHGVQVDPEMFFINCVIHSLDHFVPSFMDGIYMQHKRTSNRPFYNLVRSFFYDSMGSHEPFRTNFLVDNKERNLFYRDLYRGFSKIDEEIADWITLSISFWDVLFSRGHDRNITPIIQCQCPRWQERRWKYLSLL